MEPSDYIPPASVPPTLQPGAHPLDGFLKQRVTAQNIKPGDRLTWFDEGSRRRAVYEVTGKKKGRNMFSGETLYRVDMKRVEGGFPFDETQTVNYHRMHPFNREVQDRFDVWRRPTQRRMGTGRARAARRLTRRGL